MSAVPIKVSLLHLLIRMEFKNKYFLVYFGVEPATYINGIDTLETQVHMYNLMTIIMEVLLMANQIL